MVVNNVIIVVACRVWSGIVEYPSVSGAGYSGFHLELFYQSVTVLTTNTPVSEIASREKHHLCVILKNIFKNKFRNATAL